MWFRNLQIFRLPAGWAVTAAEIEERLSRHPLQPCGGLDRQTRGWVSPRGNDSLVASRNRQMLIALGMEQKLLPAAVVNDLAAERAAQLEARQGFRPGRKQLKEIREQVTDELLPRAFARRRTTYAWIDPVNGWLAIDAANAAKAEELIAQLGDDLEDLPLTSFDTQLSPAFAMTGWLASGDAPAGFSIDRDCVLQAPSEEKATVRYARHPLEGEEIRGHIANGKIAIRLALTWNDRISFALTDRLQIKQLAFLDILKEAAESQAGTADEQFDADFALMAGELGRFLPDLAEALGGEVVGKG